MIWGLIFIKVPFERKKHCDYSEHRVILENEINLSLVNLCPGKMGYDKGP